MAHLFLYPMAIMMSIVSASSPPRPGEPRLIHVTADAAASDPQLRTLIEDVRAHADVFVFLAGGASKMPEESQRRLLELFDALALLARSGVRLAVGDGGTQAGIMEAAGRAREASGYL